MQARGQTSAATSRRAGAQPCGADGVDINLGCPRPRRAAHAAASRRSARTPTRSARRDRRLRRLRPPAIPISLQDPPAAECAETVELPHAAGAWLRRCGGDGSAAEATRSTSAEWAGRPRCDRCGQTRLIPVLATHGIRPPCSRTLARAALHRTRCDSCRPRVVARDVRASTLCTRCDRAYVGVSDGAVAHRALAVTPVLRHQTLCPWRSRPLRLAEPPLFARRSSVHLATAGRRRA